MLDPGVHLSVTDTQTATTFITTSNTHPRMQTARDILTEDTVTLDIRVDRVEVLPEHEWFAKRIHCTDREGTHCKLTLFNDDELADYEFTESEWYRIGPCPTDVYGGSIGIKTRHTTDVEPLEDPDPQPHPGLDGDPSLLQLGASEGRLGVDIETITTVSEDTIEAYKDDHNGDTNPDHYELVAVGVGYQPRQGDPIETEVFLRDGPTPAPEFELIEDVVEFLHHREATTLLTYGGNWFDLPVFRGRAEASAEAADIDSDRVATVQQTLDEYYHADLMEGVYRVFDGGSLEAIAAKVGHEPRITYWDVYTHGFDPQPARERFEDGPWAEPSDPVFYNKDMLFFGEHYLESRADSAESVQRRALTQLIHEYTRTDIAPMFHIADDDRFAGLATWPIGTDV